jgi:hypothetical protein
MSLSSVMSVSSVKHIEYSVDQFINVAKSDKIKQGDTVMVTAEDGSNLSLPFRSMYTIVRKDLYSGYINTELFQSIAENRLGITIANYLPNQVSKTLQFEYIIMDLNHFTSVTHFDMSFGVMRNKITQFYLSDVILPDLIEIIAKYLPVQDAPDGYTAEECLANQREAKALEKGLRNEGWLI